MIRHGLTIIMCLGLVLTLGSFALATETQVNLPWDDEAVNAGEGETVGIYDIFDWKTDGQANTSISGSVNFFDPTPDNSWLKIGFGNYNGPRGCLVFYEDSSNNRHAHIEYSDGLTHSGVADLAAYTTGPTLYDFSITFANETKGTINATITDVVGTYPLTGDDVMNDPAGIACRVFATAMANGVGKPSVTSEIDMVPEPGSLLLIGLGAGFLRLRRRR